MADITIAGLSARTSLAADDQFEVDNGVTTDDSERASFALMGGLEVVHRDTDADFTMVVGEFYQVDISAWTATRTWTLPATANVGERIGIFLEAGDDAEELIVTAAASDTLNGVAGGTEWSRLFITNECIIMRCITADSVWIVEYDGRIPSQCRLYRDTTTTTAPIIAGSWSQVTFDTEDTDHDYGDIGDLANDRATPRRAGMYSITGSAMVLSVAGNNTSDTNAVNISTDEATPTILAWAQHQQDNVTWSPVINVTQDLHIASGSIGTTAGYVTVYFRHIGTGNDEIGGYTSAGGDGTFLEVLEVLKP